MTRSKLLKFAKGISLLLVIAGLTSSAPPNNPCPQIFQYKLVENKWIGVIELKNVRVDQHVNTIVTLTLPILLPSPYVGSIDLFENDQEAVQSVAEGKPLILKINFPLQDPIPRVTEIVADNVVLCNGPPDRTTQMSRLELFHIFNPNISGNFNRSMPSPSLRPGPEVECGQSQLNPLPQLSLRVFSINGTPTRNGEWPWLAAIFITNGPAPPIFQCGGTLLSSKVTITASHCLFKEGLNEPMSPYELITALGRYRINNWVEVGSLYLYTERIVFPPDYKKTESFATDIALIVHNTIVNFADYPRIRPICLWSGSGNFLDIEGQMGTVVGWGEDELGNKPSPVPKKVDVPIVSRETCIKGSTLFEKFTSSTNFCAGEKDGSGPCHGDSGSGLIINNNGHWELRGIVAGTIQGEVSERSKFCNLDQYVVYVDILPFEIWIRKIIDIHF